MPIPPRRSVPHAIRRSLLAVLLCLAPAAAVPAAEGDLEACLKRQGTRAELLRRCTAAAEDPALSAGRHAAVLNQRGLARMADGKLAEARQDFDQAIQLDPSLASAWNSRGVLFLQQGAAARAEEDEEQAVRLSPGYAFAWSNLGQARLMNGNPAGALAAQDQALRLAPTNIELVHVGRARAYLVQGDYPAALTAFAAALTANPRYANALSGQAFTRFCLGDFAAAAEDFRRERALRPDDESAIDLVIALQRAGQDAQAELAALGKVGGDEQGLPAGHALFLDKVTPQQVLQSAKDNDPWMQRQRACRANFQIGEWQLIHQRPDAARQALEAAREACDPSQLAYAAVAAELARLRAPR